MPQINIKSELIKGIKKFASNGEIEEGIKSLLIEKARNELLKYDIINRNFEKKYKMDFYKFKESSQIKSLQFETEQDYFDWEMAVTVIEDVKEELKKLVKK